MASVPHAPPPPGSQMSEEPIEHNELDSFDFELPADQIAQHPPASRQDSRLLVLDRGTGATHETRTGSLEGQLRGDEAFVINDTQVVPARLLLEKPTGGKVELLVLPQAAADQARASSEGAAGSSTDPVIAAAGPSGRRPGLVGRTNDSFFFL